MIGGVRSSSAVCSLLGATAIAACYAPNPADCAYTCADGGNGGGTSPAGLAGTTVGDASAGSGGTGISVIHSHTGTTDTATLIPAPLPEGL